MKIAKLIEGYATHLAKKIRPASSRGQPVALYHTSTYIPTYGWYVTMLTDPEPFHGYAHVYGSVSCTSTRIMITF